MDDLTLGACFAATTGRATSIGADVFAFNPPLARVPKAPVGVYESKTVVLVLQPHLLPICSHGRERLPHYALPKCITINALGIRRKLGVRRSCLRQRAERQQEPGTRYQVPA